MKEKLENEFLHAITVSGNEIVWVNYNKEIIVGDKLFDVKSFSEKDGLYFLVGVFDAEETVLNHLLEKETDHKDDNEWVQLFQSVQCACPNLSFDYFTIPAQSTIFYFPILLHMPSPFINIPTPPPQA